MSGDYRGDVADERDERIERADALRRDGEFDAAGAHYAACGLELVGSSFLSDPYHGPGMSTGLSQLFRSGVCHRIAGSPGRCGRRCVQAVAVVEDVLDRTADFEPPDNEYDRARRGAWDEFIGDFRLLGETGSADDAYDEAVETYLDAGDPDTGYSEWEHMRLMETFDQVATGAGHDEPEWPTFRSDATLTDWVEHKRDRLPAYLGASCDADRWVYDEP